MSSIEACVQVSGGAASYVACKLALEQFDPERVALVFADTRDEDEDLYRFLFDIERRLNQSITRISDGRTLWDVFDDEGMIGNSRVDPCSRILKRELLDNWRRANAPESAVIIGFEANEPHRLERTQSRMSPVIVRAPLIERGIFKEQARLIVARDGLKLPRLYEMGFPHNNCGGFCVKAGHATFGLLLDFFPDRYAEHERREEMFRQRSGKNVAVMRDRRGAQTSPLTMREFRERRHRSPQLIDWHDFGGCDCMSEPEAAA